MQSSIQSIILLNIISPEFATAVIKIVCCLFYRIKQYPISVNGNSGPFSGQFDHRASVVFKTVLIVRGKFVFCHFTQPSIASIGCGCKFTG